MSANPFQRPGESAQKTGFRFEKFFGNLLGVQPTRGSGSQWTAKLDIKAASFLMSLKFSTRDILRFGSYRMSDLMREIDQAITGQGGVGGSTIGVVVTHEQETNNTFITMRAEDWLRMIQSGDIQYVVASKGQQKRARAKIPSLLREEGEDDG